MKKRKSPALLISFLVVLVCGAVAFNANKLQTNGEDQQQPAPKAGDGPGKADVQNSIGDFLHNKAKTGKPVKGTTPDEPLLGRTNDFSKPKPSDSTVEMGWYNEKK